MAFLSRVPVSDFAINILPSRSWTLLIVLRFCRRRSDGVESGTSSTVPAPEVRWADEASERASQRENGGRSVGLDGGRRRVGERETQPEYHPQQKCSEAKGKTAKKITRDDVSERELTPSRKNMTVTTSREASHGSHPTGQARRSRLLSGSGRLGRGKGRVCPLYRPNLECNIAAGGDTRLLQRPASW